MTSPGKRPPYVVTGRVIKPYGVLGWVKVEPLTTNPRRYSEGNAFLLEGREEGERLVLEEARESPGALLVKFRGLGTREQAEELAGKRLLVTTDELGDSPRGSFWEHQVLGLEVRTRDGRCLGEVTEVMETGSNDVLVVEGERECLIPMIEEVVKSIDPGEGVIVVDPLPGLLED